jgi:diguanylate cyclase (GGDEF)-like protein/PAS domain S-box-containing protein
MQGASPQQPTAEAWHELLQTAAAASHALAAAVFDGQGRVLQTNPGMSRLLGGAAAEDACAAYFANPRFAELWQQTAEGRVFQGELSLGDGRRQNHSIRAKAQRRGARLEVVGEIDVVELDTLNGRLVELNRTISQLERELIKKNRLLEHSLEQIERKERLNGALIELNEAIGRHRQEAPLLQALCEIAVRRAGFVLAWVAVPGADGLFQPAAAAGRTAYLDGLQIRLDPAEETGQGPAATAYRSGQAEVINDFRTNDATAPWHQRARRHGIGASASLPLCGSEDVFGVLNVYAEAADYFGADEIVTLQKITTDTALALEALRQRGALRETQARYRQIFEHAPLGLVHYDTEGAIIDCNDAFVEIIGSSRERLLGLNMLRDLREQRVIDAVQQSLTAGSSFVELIYQSRRSPRATPLRAFFGAVRDADDRISGGIAICEDITERRRLETDLRDSEERFRLAVDAAGIGIWDYDVASHRLLWDRWMHRLHGIPEGRGPQDLAGWRRLLHAEDRVPTLRHFAASLASDSITSTDLRVLWPNAEIRHLRLFARVARDEAGSARRFTGACYDITEQQRAAERIRQLAFFDPLTGLANRRLLFDRLEQALARNLRNGAQGALLLLDLDGFKRVNDTRGHDVGDELLIALAGRLQSELRRIDTIARLGGDEFVVLCEGLNGEPATAQAEAQAVAGKITHLADRPYRLPSAADTTFRCPASIGVTVFDGRSRSASEVLKQADIALFEAKRGGRNTVRIFRPEMLRAIEDQEALTGALRGAVDRGELRLLYQPQVDRERHWCGCEVLLRWARDDGQMLSPFDFLDVAEASDLVKALDDWVLSEACRQLPALRAVLRGHDLNVGINVSARQFADPSFVDKVRALITRGDLGPCRLKLEVKEQALFADLAHAASTLRRLGQAGVGVGIDDFGGGPSSLPLMRKLPLQVIKIDQALLNADDTGDSDRSLIRAAIAAAHALQLPVIAEGIEQHSQFELLRAAEGCTHFQGFYFARPMPFEQFAAKLPGQLPPDARPY